MKKITGFLLLTAIYSSSLLAQNSTPSSNLPSGTGPSTIQRPPLGLPPEKLGTKPIPPGKDKKTQPGPILRPMQFSFKPTFTQPGILSLRGSGFVGVDHLYNVSGTIPVVVEFAKSEGFSVNVSQEKIQAFIEKAFQLDGINTAVRPSDGPPLPFFHMLVMIIPSGEGIAAFCEGRLFEKVEIERVALPTGVYYQAITWEYQNLISSSKTEAEPQINAAIGEIVQQFLTRYKYYKNIRPPSN